MQGCLIQTHTSLALVGVYVILIGVSTFLDKPVLEGLDALQLSALVGLSMFLVGGLRSPPCRVLEPRLERIAAQCARRFTAYRVDADRDMSAAERLGVISIPAVVVLRAGQEIERLDGLITEADLRSAFDRVGSI